MKNDIRQDIETLFARLLSKKELQQPYASKLSTISAD